jgi:hypothetical protein
VASGKDKRGRVTPKKGAPSSSSPAARRPRSERPSILPRRIGPFDRPDKGAPLGQVGRRPSSPTKLFVFAIVYLVCGVASFFVLTGSFAVILGIVFIGFSLFWLRGASTALVRQQQRRETESD